MSKLSDILLLRSSKKCKILQT